MVAAAQDVDDQPASVVESTTVKDDVNHVALLIERIEQCIQDDNDEASSPYWQRAVGEQDAEEARRVYDAMLQDADQLERILEARKHNLKLSTDLFFEQVRFRAKWRPLEITPNDIPTALPSGAWRLCGYSKEGCVISNYKLRFWNPDDYGADSDSQEQLDSSIAEYTKYILYMIELMICSMKPLPVPQQFVVLFDLSGFSVSLVFKSNVRLMIRKLIYVAQAQYPERLHKVLLVNAPYGFATAWKLIRPLLDEKTASKIHFVEQDKITDDIDATVLSEEYGGSHEEYQVPAKTLEEEKITHI